uniref:Meiotic recombination protein REC8-like protein n=1 Tax=Magallana gigas TaxID=29159 RepID=K1Q6X6_MAGGI
MGPWESTECFIRSVFDDILDYIMVRKQPSVPGRSRPRFSLYLSAKLMYGCVKLYRKQTQYLLALGSPHTVSSLDQITLKDVDIPNLPQPCERIRSLHKSLIPFKNLRWRERIRERNVVPQGKNPSGSA